MKRNRMWIIAALGAAAMLMIAGIAQALKTEQVELGRDGLYDGQVYLQRDASGNLVLMDDQQMSPVTLSDLRTLSSAHGSLTGLGADDHPQYLTGARHDQTHSADYNDQLAISPDTANHTTLGAHMQDADIHLNRNGSETIGGNWIFSGTPEFRHDLKFSNAGSPGNFALTFEDGTADAQLLWNDASNRFEFNRLLKVGTLDMTTLTGGTVLATGDLRTSGTVVAASDFNGKSGLKFLRAGVSYLETDSFALYAKKVFNFDSDLLIRSGRDLLLYDGFNGNLKGQMDAATGNAAFGGKLGVGTTSYPSSTFHVAGTSTLAGAAATSNSVVTYAADWSRGQGSGYAPESFGDSTGARYIHPSATSSAGWLDVAFPEITAGDVVSGFSLTAEVVDEGGTEYAEARLLVKSLGGISQIGSTLSATKDSGVVANSSNINGYYTVPADARVVVRVKLYHSADTNETRVFGVGITTRKRNL